MLKVWRDRSDRMSVLRVVTLVCLFSPLGKAIYDSDTIKLDARPITNLIHRTGDWTLIFLLVALAVTPLSRILRFNRLLDVRRMIGMVPLPMPPPMAHCCPEPMRQHVRSWRKRTLHRHRDVCGRVRASPRWTPRSMPRLRWCCARALIAPPSRPAP